jgi:hypothetical protein
MDMGMPVVSGQWSETAGKGAEVAPYPLSFLTTDH